MKVYHRGIHKASFAIDSRNNHTLVAFSFAHGNDSFTRARSYSILERRLEKGFQNLEDGRSLPSMVIDMGNTELNIRLFNSLRDLFRTALENYSGYERVSAIKERFSVLSKPLSCAVVNTCCGGGCH